MGCLNDVKKLTAVRRKQKKPKEDTDDSYEESELEVPELAIAHEEEKTPEVFSMPLLPAEVSEPIIDLQIVATKKRRLSSGLSQKHKKI
jgi:hypothetical protein